GWDDARAVDMERRRAVHVHAVPRVRQGGKGRHRLGDRRNPAPRQELDDEGYGGRARPQRLRAASAVGQEAAAGNDRCPSDGDDQFQHVSSRESHRSLSYAVSLVNGKDAGNTGLAPATDHNMALRTSSVRWSREFYCDEASLSTCYGLCHSRCGITQATAAREAEACRSSETAGCRKPPRRKRAASRPSGATR